eukprot:TRINITY_DN16973_c0_g1_i2.p2 TRINITY_DN16973_c0_g1~~TRINITY_DN16973_c0_g1_i2.p2  ORF type:complete len:216 (-),score=55.46 TRINITY_DN16973_c0_g1_i2:56-703(-)
MASRAEPAEPLRTSFEELLSALRAERATVEAELGSLRAEVASADKQESRQACCLENGHAEQAKAAWAGQCKVRLGMPVVRDAFFEGVRMPGIGMQMGPPDVFELPSEQEKSLEIEMIFDSASQLEAIAGHKLARRDGGDSMELSQMSGRMRPGSGRARLHKSEHAELADEAKKRFDVVRIEEVHCSGHSAGSTCQVRCREGFEVAHAKSWPVGDV